MAKYIVGSIVSFGGYEWRILDTKAGAALLIAENIIEQRAYHSTYQDITWAQCSLRDYLNGEFLESFVEADRERIIPVLIKNDDNQWYGTSGGDDTRDSIFLLSIEEAVCRYFGDSSAKLYNARKNQRYWFERKDENNTKRTARFAEEDGGIWWWWLRSPGRVGVKAAYIHGDGNIGIQGNNIMKGNVGGPFHNGDSQGGIRPALWLKTGE